MNWQRLKTDLRTLSYVYPIAIGDDCETIIIKNFLLPPGYNGNRISVLLEIPQNYPESAPGVGDAKVYVPETLRYRGRKPADFHDSSRYDGWAWWCYEWIKWNPQKDNFITFFEMLRAHMTNPD